MADIRLFAEETYTSSSLEITDKQDNTKETTDTTSLEQRYRLDLSRNITPLWSYFVGGLFRQIDATFENTNEDDRDIKVTKKNPYIGLRYQSDLVGAGVRYNYIEDTRDNGDKDYRKQTSADLVWSPVDLPSANLTYTRTEIYDEDRTVRDTTSDAFRLTSNYEPTDTVELGYNGAYGVQRDDLRNTERTTIQHAAWIDYYDIFMDGKMSWQSGYNFNYQTSEYSIDGEESTRPALASQGLSIETNLPPDSVALEQNNALNDGFLAQSAGLNLGLTLLPVDFNIGLELPVGSGQINTLSVYILQSSLPPAVSNSFAWQLYTSDDNQNWDALGPLIVNAPLDPELTDINVSKFILRFPATTTRYIKVVTQPLSPAIPEAINFPNILVTEIKAGLTEVTGDSNRKTSQTTHFGDVNARVTLLDSPNLSYLFSLDFNHSDQSDATRVYVSNGLSLYHTFNPRLSGVAFFTRDDDYDDLADNWDVIYKYSASLRAQPIPALSHTLTYSGSYDPNSSNRDKANNYESSYNHSISMVNRANLYQNVNMLLNGSASYNKREDSSTNKSYNVNMSMNARPHRTLNLFFDLARDYTTTDSDNDSQDSYSNRARLGASITPTRALAVNAEVSYFERDYTKNTLYTWSLNWSPFRDGSLQFAMRFDERYNYTDDGDNTSRVFSPTVRWKINPSLIWDFTYSYSESDREDFLAERDTFVTRLKGFF